MKRHILSLLSAILLTIIIPTGVYALNADSPSLVGADLSWPNCASDSINYNWGVVGANGGLDFTSNHCIFDEASLFNKYSVYMNTGYPGSNYGDKYANYPDQCPKVNKYCLAYNYGYNAALYALRAASLQGVHTNFWWLDVETVNSWTNSFSQNIGSLKGMLAAIQKNTLLTSIGFYSDSFQWKTITGGWQNDLPNWVATGSSQYSLAQKNCNGQRFNGGSTYLTQFTLTFDRNYACDLGFMTNLSNK